MDIFKFRNDLITNYSEYVRSFFEIKDEKIEKKVEDQFDRGLLWPEVLIQLNPTFKAGDSMEQLIGSGVLHPKCGEIFQRRNEDGSAIGPFTLHTHQVTAVKAARDRQNYVLTTGTGSGKSLTYILPIVDQVLREGTGKGIKAIIVYPMNALANSQENELKKFLDPFNDGSSPVSYRRYTGQESDEEREQILQSPPDILLTNYVMLELILTRPRERKLVQSATDLRFLVLDELHTYRGRQGADVALLLRRLKNQIKAPNLLCVGTSATMGGKQGQNKEEVVSSVASLIFGQDVHKENVIGETLEPVSKLDLPTSQELQNVLDPLSPPIPDSIQDFVAHPMTRWVENTFGLRKLDDGRLERADAKSILGAEGAAEMLSQLTGIDESLCAEAIKKTLLSGFQCKNATTGNPLFAFRLHQFISRGGSVYSSLEPPENRHITLNGQKYVPSSNREKLLYPLAFCRECGQDFTPVARHQSVSGDHFEIRDLGVLKFEEDHIEAGFLLSDPNLQWPAEDNEEAQHEYVPSDWIENFRGRDRIHRNRRDYLPRTLEVDGLGKSCEADQGHQFTFLTAPFRFCPSCKVSYDFRQRSDLAKLTSLGTEGRSTATTILSLFTLLGLKDEGEREEAQKLLSFTDNRQDAALQAGHYNDFVEVGLLRSALFRALDKAGSNGLKPSEIQAKVFDALKLDFDDYASEPGVKGSNRTKTATVLREVLAYRVYRDLKRGWRVIMPNLEQVGLLQIDYANIRELVEDEDEWQENAALATATPDQRETICRTLFDFMRRGLAIKVEALDAGSQETLQKRSYGRLKAPWALGEDERLESACVLYPRSTSPDDPSDNLFLSAMSGFGQYLKRQTTFPEYDDRLTGDETQTIIREILKASRNYGFLEVVDGEKDDEAPGYQLQAEEMIWKAGAGTEPFHDIIRMPNPPKDGGKVNPFFVRFYKELAERALTTEAQDHTAQVRAADRETRENRFRRGSLPAADNLPKGLPILYCSPTMELGIDIKELNTVNMRNVPPTPANYAQRSGRAGRSGSPAMVSTYCSTFSAHDQFFFARPKQMVSGIVSAPRIEVANEDLVRAHVFAIWLSVSGLDLKSKMVEILDADGESPTLDLQPSISEKLSHLPSREKAKLQAKEVLNTITTHLEQADWWDNEWINRTIDSVEADFVKACRRWKNLYNSAQRQIDESTRIARDASRSMADKNRAKSLMIEALNQLNLLTQQGTGSSLSQSDFYTYRYFASEGFLPGYSFPRLPLSAYIPAKRAKQNESEYVSRARFIAVSEFGPQAMIYHGGNKYQVTRCLIPLNEDGDASHGLQKQRLKLCPACGFLHTGPQTETLTNCDQCNQAITESRDNLFRMENVSATKRKRISSDEEERLRLGFEVRSGLRWAERDGRLSYISAKVIAADGTELFEFFYGSSATIWRINLGWRRRRQEDGDGFFIDTESGQWKKNPMDDGDQDGDNTVISRPERVIPYVEDRRNALLIKPSAAMDLKQMASLQAALKQGIQIEYQLEDMELAAEPLPSMTERNQILFFESAEGGAGVLRRLVHEPEAIAQVAIRTLDICHFSPTGEDQKRAPGADEDCESACYQCLLSYTNQRDHGEIDRHQVRETLLSLTTAQTVTSGTQKPRPDHLAGLLALCDSDLERKWLNELESRSLKLPSHAQLHLEEHTTRPDFFYTDESTAIYIDGPHHDASDQAAQDEKIEERLEAAGIRVIRFRYDQDWETLFEQYRFLFGSTSQSS